MNQIFKSVLLLSAVGAALSGLLLLLKPITRKAFGSTWQYYIWLLVLVIMLLPVQFDRLSKTEATPFLTSAAPSVMPVENIQPQRQDGSAQQEIPLQAPVQERNIQIRGINLNIIDVLILLWMLGSAIFLSGAVISYIRFIHILRNHSTLISCSALEYIKAKKHIKRNIRVRRTNLLTAPLMVGLIRPVLLLPDAPLEKEELNYILLHELTHFKRHDLWYKWFALLVNAVHWFNPVIYFVVRQINQECELSCDLSVIKQMSIEEKKGYMNTIIGLAARKKGGTVNV